MGLFDRKKTVLSATTASMVTDSPDIVQQSVLTSIARDTDIATDLIANLQSGLAASIQRYYATGKYHKEQEIADLFPTSHNSLFTTHTLDIEYVLSNIHGESVNILNYTQQPLDTNMLAFEYMSTTYGYNIGKSSFTSSPTGESPAHTVYDSSYLVDGVLHIRYRNTQNENIFTETTTVTGLDSAEVYYHVIYVLYSAPETYLHWNYKASLNTYPFLTRNEFKHTEGYFPVVPIIEYKQPMTHPAYEGTPQYQVSKALMNTIGLDFVNVHDSLAESSSYGDIEQAHFTCSVRLQDDNQLALQYMFRMFESLYVAQKYDQGKFVEWQSLASNSSAPPVNSLNYRMSAFKVDLRWMYMTSKIVSKPWAYGEDKYKRFHIVKDKQNITYTSGNGDVISSRQYYDPSTITFIRKVDDNTQEEITVVGLAQINYINDQYSKEWDVGEMFDTSEDGQDPVTFLVQADLARNAFPRLMDLNTFYYRTFTLVLNFKTVVNLKWYQTGFFQFVMVIVAIVITVWSAGTMAESIALAYSVAGGGTAGILAAAGQALLIAGISATTSWVMAELMKTYGWEAIAILAVVMIAIVGLSGDIQSFLPDGFTISQFTNDITKSFETFFKESSQDILAKANQEMEAYKEWEEEYEKMYEETFALSEAFSEVYADYMKEKAIYNSLAPDEFMFVALDMLIMSPTIVTRSTESFIDTALNPDSGLAQR